MDNVKAVKALKRLKNHPVCLSNEGELSIDMEEILSAMPNNPNVKVDKVFVEFTNSICKLMKKF